MKSMSRPISSSTYNFMDVPILPHNLILQAIGWLAREDKFFDKASFRVSKKEGEFLVLRGA